MIKTKAFSSVLLVIILFTLPFCKKNNENDCNDNSYGGVGSPDPTFKFWTKLPMYNTKIEVKNNSGTIISSKTMSGYYNIPAGSPIEPDPCDQQSVDAIFSLKIGQSYSYVATNRTNKWSGTIKVDCSVPFCNLVEIK